MVSQLAEARRYTQVFEVHGKAAKLLQILPLWPCSQLVGSGIGFRTDFTDTQCVKPAAAPVLPFSHQIQDLLKPSQATRLSHMNAHEGIPVSLLRGLVLPG